MKSPKARIKNEFLLMIASRVNSVKISKYVGETQNLTFMYDNLKSKKVLNDKNLYFKFQPIKSVSFEIKEMCALTFQGFPNPLR